MKRASIINTLQAFDSELCSLSIHETLSPSNMLSNFAKLCNIEYNYRNVNHVNKFQKLLGAYLFIAVSSFERPVNNNGKSDVNLQKSIQSFHT